MRFAVVSDVHSNHIAIEEVLKAKLQHQGSM